MKSYFVLATVVVHVIADVVTLQTGGVAEPSVDHEQIGGFVVYAVANVIVHVVPLVPVVTRNAVSPP